MSDKCPTHPDRPLVTEHTSGRYICLVCRYIKNPDTETARREKVRLSKAADIARASKSYQTRRAAGVDTELSRKLREGRPTRRAEKQVAK